MINIIFHKNSKAIKILGPVFSLEFGKFGYQTKEITTDDIDAIQGKSKDIFLVFAPHKFKNFHRTGKNKSSTFIAYQQEQLQPDDINHEMRIDQVKQYINKYDLIIEADKSNIKYLKALGQPPSFILPTAYHEYLEFKRAFAENDQQWECIFFGRVAGKPRRKKILNVLKKKYLFYPKFEGIYDRELERAVIQSQIVLNIHQSDNNFFPERLRVVIGISNKRLIISEPMKNIEPLIPNKHFLSCPYGEFNDKIDYYLNNKDAYKILTDKAYNFIKKSFRMGDFIQEFIKKIIYPITGAKFYVKN